RMRADFVTEVARQNGIEQVDLIEKDLILHQILTDLSQNEFFSNNFVFKGGTCLTKCYLGYYRFSEDIDFTWKDQAVFECKSQMNIRRLLSEVIDKAGGIFEGVAKKRVLDFKCEKHNRHYVELGGSNKMCTFKIWYHAETLNVESFVKVQMNFVEKLIFAPQKSKLSALQCKQSSELSFLFPEYSEYCQTISFNVYDTREILCEKVRSILTREGFKARDFLDVYLICKKYGLNLEDLVGPVVAKICFVLGIYKKYQENFEAKKTMLASEPFRWGEEKRLLLHKIDGEEFDEFLGQFPAVSQESD
ncbi:MAG: nucleotidyl transferase AbiEii/AbiGii toxin family protein, partial [Crenarchaeota archaeon]|nr:nucleotidyl transferase AbiEii/AbiGii toxin family protein [Thermoproteota archaeon]